MNWTQTIEYTAESGRAKRVSKFDNEKDALDSFQDLVQVETKWGGEITSINLTKGKKIIKNYAK